MNKARPHHELQRSTGTMCQVCSVVVRIGPLAFALLFLALCTLDASEDNGPWIHSFDFISFARKYAHVSTKPDAFSFSVGVAIAAGMLMGVLCGFLGRWNLLGFRMAVSRWPRWLKIISFIFLPGIALLPFLDLGDIDPLSRHDQVTASILSNEIATAAFLAALHLGYFAFYMLISVFIRNFLARR